MVNKRHRRTQADMDAIRKGLIEITRRGKQMTVRQVFYQAVVHGLIDKTEEDYKGVIIRLLTDMRISGDIPFSRIIDETRRRDVTQTDKSIASAARRAAKFYRRSALDVCPAYIEVWCEKEALSGFMWEAASEYDVPVLTSKGMPSITQVYGSATWINSAHNAGKESFIYQFGDHDPTGIAITRAMIRRLTEFCGLLDCPPPLVQRVALTPEQIEEFNLPTRPTKREGNTHAANFEGDSVELDALPPEALTNLITECIKQHINDRDLAVLREAEASERSLIYAWANRWSDDEEDDEEDEDEED
jgi:hypothetical protein